MRKSRAEREHLSVALYRVFGGRRFGFISSCHLKAEATKKAERVRRQGYSVRVIRQSGRYLIYASGA